jgi:hypothetical protein
MCGQHQLGVARVHRERAGHDHFARQIARLTQHVVPSGPMHGTQERVGFARGVFGCAGRRLPLSLAREPRQLLLAPGVAEYHLMSGSREDGSQLGAHQAGTENADSHGALPHWLSQPETGARRIGFWIS